MSIAGRGHWKVESKSDPRWNKQGRGYGAVTAGGPQEMKDWIKKCCVKYGEPPKDGTMQFMKD